MFKPRKVNKRAIKEIDYFGQSVIVLRGAKYIATDESGKTYTYQSKPLVQKDFWLGVSGSNYVCDIEFEGNWRDSLMVIKNVKK